MTITTNFIFQNLDNQQILSNLLFKVFIINSFYDHIDMITAILKQCWLLMFERVVCCECDFICPFYAMFISYRGNQTCHNTCINVITWDFTWEFCLSLTHTYIYIYIVCILGSFQVFTVKGLTWKTCKPPGTQICVL